MYTTTEQLTQLADIQMAMDSTPTAYLEMIHANLILGELKTSLYRPARESYSKQFFQCNPIRAGQHIRDKIFNLIRIQYVTGNDKTMSRTWQPITALFTIKLRPFHFPYYRAFFAFLNIKFLPPLLLKFTGVNKQILNFRRRLFPISISGTG